MKTKLRVTQTRIKPIWYLPSLVPDDEVRVSVRTGYRVSIHSCVWSACLWGLNFGSKCKKIELVL